MAGTDLPLVIAVSRALRRIHAEPEALLRERGVTPAQFAVLELLLHKGEQTVGEIVERILMTPGNVTVVVRNLERSGLIVRRPDPGDRRIGRISLSDCGESLISELFPEHEKAISRSLAILSQAEKRTIVRLMSRIARQDRRQQTLMERRSSVW